MTGDPARSAELYRSISGPLVARAAALKFKSVRPDCGPSLQLHLAKHLPGDFRSAGVDNNDCHFAFRTDDFEGILARLVAAGFREHAADRNIIEVNTAA